MQLTVKYTVESRYNQAQRTAKKLIYMEFFRGYSAYFRKGTAKEVACSRESLVF